MIDLWFSANLILLPGAHALCTAFESAGIMCFHSFHWVFDQVLIAQSEPFSPLDPGFFRYIVKSISLTPGLLPKNIKFLLPSPAALTLLKWWRKRQPDANTKQEKLPDRRLKFVNLFLSTENRWLPTENLRQPSQWLSLLHCLDYILFSYNMYSALFFHHGLCPSLLNWGNKLEASLNEVLSVDLRNCNDYSLHPASQKEGCAIRKGEEMQVCKSNQP